MNVGNHDPFVVGTHCRTENALKIVDSQVMRIIECVSWEGRCLEYLQFLFPLFLSKCLFVSYSVPDLLAGSFPRLSELLILTEATFRQYITANFLYPYYARVQSSISGAKHESQEMATE